MTTVRIVLVRRPYIRPARAPDGSDVPGWRPHQRLIVLADDAGHRAVPLWVIAGRKGLLGRLGRPAGDAEVASGRLETAVRLLGTAGTKVSAVDIEPASDDVPELRSDTVTARVGLALRAASPGRSMPSRAASPDPRDDPGNHVASATGTGEWTRYEVTAEIPADANLIRFGVFLNGGGQLELRHPALALHPPGQQSV